MPIILTFLFNLDSIKSLNCLIWEKTKYSQLNDITRECPFPHRMNFNRFSNDSIFPAGANWASSLFIKEWRGALCIDLGSRHYAEQCFSSISETNFPQNPFSWVKRRAVTSWHKSNHNQIIKHRCLWGLRSSSPRVPYCLLNKYFFFLIEFDILPFWFQNIGPLQTIK